MTKQQRKTARRKARQQVAWRKYLAHFRPPAANMDKVEALRRLGFDRMPRLNKQYVMEHFAC